MHKLLHKEFEMSDFSFDKLPGYRNEIKQFRPEIDEEEELWRKIDCDYEVSNQGRIRHGVRILSGSVHKDGYIFATIHGKQTPVHRFVASKFIPNPERKPEVNHKDGNKMNNCASNLEWVTRSENQQHAVDNGFQPRGMANYCGKFSEEQRDEIKRLWDNGEMTRRQLAKKYGVSHTCINDIINDKYKYIRKVNVYETVARTIVDTANALRDAWFATENIDEKREIWYSIIQLLPEGYNQKRTVTMSYENVVNMIRQRTNHKLTEWREFVEILRGLPYIEDIITPKTEEEENV
jgi:DNA-binding XRE family transcriptional regulator